MKAWAALVAVAVGLGVPSAALAAGTAPSAVTDPPTITSPTAATLNGELETGGDDTSYHFEYATAANTFCTSSGTSGAPSVTSTQTVPGSTPSSPVAANVTGLTGGTDYCYRLVASNADGSSQGDLTTFTSGAPTAVTNGANATGATTATVTGTVNPAGATTHYHVEYDLNSSVWCQNGGTTGSPAHSTTSQTLGFTDASDHDVSIDLTGLTSGADYCAQLVADNASATTAGGTVGPFNSLPQVVTNQETSTGATTATITGSVDPVGQSTTYFAQYDVNSSSWCQSNGTSGSPAHTTSSQPLGATDTTVHDVSVGLTGLTAGTDYCAQIVAQNGSGTGPGGTITFTAGAPLADTFDGLSTSATTVRVEGDVNPAGQSTQYSVNYDLASSTWCQNFGSSGSPAHTTTPQTLGVTDSNFHNVSVDLSGLTANTAYCAQVMAHNASGTVLGATVSFTAGVPLVDTTGATQTSPTSVTVDGDVNPSGTSTTYTLLWDLGTSTWCTSGGSSGSPAHQTTSQPLGFTDATSHPLSVPLSGLTTGTAYCAEISATNSVTTVAGSPPVTFTPASTPFVTETAATATGATTETLAGTVDPNGLATTYVFQWDVNSSAWCTSGGASGSPGQTTTPASAGSGSTPQTVSTDLTGLTPGATYCWQVSATNSGGTTVTGTDTFRAGLPDATTDAASAIGSSGATLNGHVNPEGNSTTFSFDYDLASSAWCTSNGASGGPTFSSPTNPSSVGATDTASHAVSTVLSGLASGTGYCFRIDASSAAGGSSGGLMTFTTTGPSSPPAASTGTPDAVTTTTATLHGTVNPNGLATTYHFEYGTTTAYGSSTADQSAGSGSGVVTVQAGLTGLTAATTYHVRLVASNGAGPATGGDQTFTTAPAPVSTHNLVATVSGAGSGLVTSTPAGISCPGTCVHAFPAAAVVTLHAAAASGSTFSGWSGACTGSGACSVTLSADRSVTATFVKSAPPPRCKLALTGKRVLVKAKKGSKAKPGILTVRITCDRGAALTLTGTITVTGKKPKHGQAKKKTFTLPTVRANGRAGTAAVLTIRLPGGALSALKAGGAGTLHLSLAAKGGGGTGRSTANVSGIRAG